MEREENGRLKKYLLFKNEMCYDICALHSGERHEKFGGESTMDGFHEVNEKFVNLFNHIMDIEEKAVITEEFKEITNNDMHVMEAIGIKDPKNMSTIAKDLSITVGTLTIAVNNLVKKGYVNRKRSEFDRRVVLVSLSEKGKKAFFHHKQFHEEMMEAALKNLDEGQTELLVKVLSNLEDFVLSYMK